ncbi:Stf0 family sulfotransferase [Marinobacterium mangrovicola]|uniref:LPS sulfotransferase NodH n=1 Tax=Marinobacterium mangrovicola TaxID=1476959 RepID=A0A4R1GJA9_9GAMM|nr:Stf0 family sulfotransferase [Marinobacterium mangrovicola]TCK07250.1 LPS sulfotransferase NodH [Marinobacterium mangrovicola]
MKRLVILSTQRSGSTMVCDDIAGAGALGRPSEYFIKVIDSSEKVDSQELKRLIREVDERGQTENDITAVKIMSNQIRPIGKALKKSGILNIDDADECFYEYFKGSVFVRVRRADKVAQAVSRVMAQQTDVYHSADETNGLEGMLGKVSKSRDNTKLHYDEVAIRNSLKSIGREEAFLDQFVSKFSLNVVNIRYEDVVKDRSYVSKIGELFGLESVSLNDRRLRKISGSEAAEWIEKFKMVADS